MTRVLERRGAGATNQAFDPRALLPGGAACEVRDAGCYCSNVSVGTSAAFDNVSAVPTVQEVEEALSWEEEEMPSSWEESWEEETLSCRPQTPLERGLQTPLESGGIVAQAHLIMLMTSGSRGLTRLIGVWRRPGRRARPNRR